MGERGDSSERHSNLTPPWGPRISSSETTFQRHKLKWEQDVRELVYQILLEKFMEDLEMAIKLFTLKTRMLRIHQKREAMKFGGILASSSYDWYDDDYDVELAEVAIKEEYRTRKNRDHYRTFYSRHPGRRDLTPFYNEHQEIGPSTLRRVRLLRHVMKEDLEISLNEIPTQQELSAYAMIQCILRHMHRRSWKKYDKKFGMGHYYYHSEDDPDDSFFIPPCIPSFFSKSGSSTSTTSQSSKSTHKSDENLHSHRTQSSCSTLLEERSCTDDELQEDADLEQNLFYYYNNEFIKYLTTGFPPVPSILSGVSDLDVAYNYIRSLNDEVQEYFKWSEITVDLEKPSLRTDFPTQDTTEPVPTTGEIPPIKIEFDVDIDVDNHKHEIEKHIPNQSQMKMEPEVLSVPDQVDPTNTTKKKRTRCMHCNKRLNITNTYTCRCGKIFCSQHRYSECHDCSYDYKAEGRKLLEKKK